MLTLKYGHGRNDSWHGSHITLTYRQEIMTRKEIIAALRAYRGSGRYITCSLNASNVDLYDAFFNAFGAYPDAVEKYNLNGHKYTNSSYYLSHSDVINEWIDEGWGNRTMDDLDRLFTSEEASRSEAESIIESIVTVDTQLAETEKSYLNIDDTDVANWEQQDLLHEILRAAMNGYEIKCCIDGTHEELFREYMRLYGGSENQQLTADTASPAIIVDESLGLDSDLTEAAREILPEHSEACERYERLAIEGREQRTTDTLTSHTTTTSLALSFPLEPEVTWIVTEEDATFCSLARESFDGLVINASKYISHLFWWKYKGFVDHSGYHTAKEAYLGFRKWIARNAGTLQDCPLTTYMCS